MAKQNNTQNQDTEVKAFSTFLDEELAKDSPDKQAIIDRVAAEVEAAVAEAKSSIEGGQEGVELLKQENAALKEKLELSEMTAKDPNAARLRSINGEKNLKLTVEEDGKKRKARFVFKVAKFNIPGKGELTAREILDNPDQHAEVIARLVERKSPILVEVGKKKAK